MTLESRLFQEYPAKRETRKELNSSRSTIRRNNQGFTRSVAFSFNFVEETKLKARTGRTHDLCDVQNVYFAGGHHTPLRAAYIVNFTFIGYKKKRKYYGRLFGHFGCKKCANRWASAFSYARVWQKCKECFAKATPHNLIEHEIKEDNKNDPGKKRKPHRADLCGMCSSGTPCQAVRDQQLPDVIQALQRVTLVEPAR
ncbi:Oidioi.mRNA.OKI2018_I69.XSR.g13448.t1.cds [Oikopleura dioica]|uniref:Oidioi.mRNA.OKI2018_I69.XSR.g13448.t1.cds n=1 Tax=Oikopleura dioica TaxID=34765 RepID=A0ABN7SC24_OIKDI|nr:Oidioi.mRNA.OKI2018_I69.XSR.g13448.t1.cds [Oikopleura dioica]